MTWFKVDDGFWGHPKQTALPPGPVALWVRAGSWSGSQLTDGFVPTHMVTMLGAKKRDAEQLAAAGLWERVDGGYQFHDWAKWQPTRAEVEKKRAEDSDRKAEWRRKKAEQKAAATNVSQRDSGRTDVVTPRGVRSTRPDPTRPDPSSPYGEDEEGSLRGVSHVSRGGAEQPPLYPDRCSAHGNDPQPGNCGNCADARKAAKARPALALVTPSVFDRKPWCGHCDEHTRLRDYDGTPYRCPECHPLAEEAS